MGEVTEIGKVREERGKIVFTAAGWGLSNLFHQLTLQAYGGIYSSMPQEKERFHPMEMEPLWAENSETWRRAYNVGRPSPLVWSSLEKMPCTRKDCSQGALPVMSSKRSSHGLLGQSQGTVWVKDITDPSVSHTQPPREHTEDDGKAWEINRSAAQDGVLRSRENVRALLTSKLNQTTQWSRKPSSESSHLKSESA